MPRAKVREMVQPKIEAHGPIEASTVEMLGEAWSLGWRMTARCAYGKREGMKSIRECVYRYDLDMETMLCTRGPDFPLAMLATRLRMSIGNPQHRR